MKIVVLGSYQTKFGELWDKSLKDLIVEAGLGAIKDAGIKKKQIEVVFVANKLAGQLVEQNHLSALVAEQLDLSVPVIRIEAACASGGVAVAQACTSIYSGLYDCALVIGVEKMTDLAVDQIAAGLMTAASEPERQSGFSFVGLYALMAKKYLAQYGAEEKDLAWPAVKNHGHASLNPKAHLGFAISLEQVEKSSLIADPLRLMECSPVSDGAAALVLANKKIKAGKSSVYITASSMASMSLSLENRTSLTSIKSTQQAALQAYKQAGLGPQDLSLLEVHDCFSIAEILALEDLGICPQGEGFILERNGQLKLGGKSPVNVSGGLKACGHPVGATGVKQLVEVCQQLRREVGQRQVKGAKVGLTHNIGGTGGTAVVHILQR